MPVKKLVLGIEAVHDQAPEKTILLEGVGEALFWNAVYGRPFRLFGADEVYLTPEAVDRIPPYPELGNVADYTLSTEKIRSGLQQNRILTFGLETGELRDITPLYRDTMLHRAVPRRIELSHPPMDSLLGPSWYAPEGDYRWMPKTATVRLGVPPSGHGQIRVQGFCAPVQLQSGPITAWLSAEGEKSPAVEIRDCGHAVILTLPLIVRGEKNEIEVTLQVNRTITLPSDNRNLGLAVQSIEFVEQP